MSPPSTLQRPCERGLIMVPILPVFTRLVNRGAGPQSWRLGSTSLSPHVCASYKSPRSPCDVHCHHPPGATPAGGALVETESSLPLMPCADMEQSTGMGGGGAVGVVASDRRPHFSRDCPPEPRGPLSAVPLLPATTPAIEGAEQWGTPAPRGSAHSDGFKQHGRHCGGRGCGSRFPPPPRITATAVHWNACHAANGLLSPENEQLVMKTETRATACSQAQLSFPPWAHRCKTKTPLGLAPASKSALLSPWPRGHAGNLPPGACPHTP